jgi:CheY-like chemotaxis protein
MKNILIVDDNLQNLYLLRALLSGHGYGVTEAANGAEALEKARNERPDLIVSDILMPIMDGFALCREWKRDDRLKDIPFVFFTATYTDRKDEEFALGLGAERFVVKPQEPEIFLSIIDGVFSEHKAGRVAVPRERQHDETVYFREYNEALIRKLENKVVQVEEARRRLEREAAERIRTEEALRLANERYSRHPYSQCRRRRHRSERLLPEHDRLLPGGTRAREGQLAVRHAARMDTGRR